MRGHPLRGGGGGGSRRGGGRGGGAGGRRGGGGDGRPRRFGGAQQERGGAGRPEGHRGRGGDGKPRPFQRHTQRGGGQAGGGAGRHGGQRERPRDEHRPASKAALWRPGPDARLVRAEAGMRLSSFVAHEHPSLSVRAARRLIDEGACRVNGRIETFSSRTLAVGDVVEVFLPEEPREHTFDERRILFDQHGVLAYDKPAWLPVTPIEGPKSWSLLDILKLSVEGPVIPVHRLDADTSGIVLFAREERLARALEDRFREHLVVKTYHALVRGHPRQTGERRSYLVKVDAGKGFERWRSGRGPDAREAHTTWEVEERIGAYASLVRVMPKTGRYHQIRIHFSEMGHPIYGDRTYGDRQDPVHVGRHLLHASRVELELERAKIDIKSRLPREFERARERLLAL